VLKFQADPSASRLGRDIMAQPERVRYGSFPRSGIFLPWDYQSRLKELQAFLDKETRPGEAVLFFPNEAAYYFLFDRMPPSRYVMSYFAVTTDHRRAMIADLEQTRPRFVVFSPETWRIDNIPEDRQVPELMDYLNDRYAPHGVVGTFQIARRKDG
jgi:hypothetical protein